MTDETAQVLGFDDAAEFFKLTANADMSTLEKIAAFKQWQSEDGTKKGLLDLASS